MIAPVLNVDNYANPSYENATKNNDCQRFLLDDFNNTKGVERKGGRSWNKQHYKLAYVATCLAIAALLSIGGPVAALSQEQRTADQIKAEIQQKLTERARLISIRNDFRSRARQTQGNSSQNIREFHSHAVVAGVSTAAAPVVGRVNRGEGAGLAWDGATNTYDALDKAKLGGDQRRFAEHYRRQAASFDREIARLDREIAATRRERQAALSNQAAAQRTLMPAQGQQGARQFQTQATNAAERINENRGKINVLQEQNRFVSTEDRQRNRVEIERLVRENGTLAGEINRNLLNARAVQRGERLATGASRPSAEGGLRTNAQTLGADRRLSQRNTGRIEQTVIPQPTTNPAAEAFIGAVAGAFIQGAIGAAMGGGRGAPVFMPTTNPGYVSQARPSPYNCSALNRPRIRIVATSPAAAQASVPPGYFCYYVGPL